MGKQDAEQPYCRMLFSRAKEVLIQATMEMNLENTTLGDRSQTNTGGSYHGQKGGWRQEGLRADCFAGTGLPVG